MADSTQLNIYFSISCDPIKYSLTGYHFWAWTNEIDQ